MILKEAYRYQNFLTNLISNAQTYLGNGSFVMTTTQKHMKSKANPEATDDDLEVPKSYNVDFTPIQLVDFLMDAIQEKQKLSDAIAEAKKNTEIDLDSSYAMNKTKQSLVKVFKTMAGRKATETEKQGRDYRFNVNQEQVAYTYTIKEVTKLDYDRNVVKALAKKLAKETDEVSTKLDQLELTTEVDFEPKYDMNDTLEDIVVK